MASDQGRGSVRTRRDAAREYYWGVFLKGYRQDNPEAKDEFVKATGLNRKQRRQLEAKTRRLRAKAGR